MGGSFWAVLILLGVVGSLPGQTYYPPATHRLDVSLNAGWKFIQQDVAGAQAVGFNDTSWTNISLPHTWDVARGQDGPGTAYYRGIGWYRSHYTVDGSLTNRHFFLKFDGAFSVADVWINGNYLGEHQGGFAAFAFDVAPYVNIGADNVIAVKVNNSFNTNLPPLDADFTFWGGIYRNVHLLVTDPVHISPLDYGSSGVYLTTTSVGTNSANLQVATVVSNATTAAQTVTVRAVITDAATNIVAVLTNSVTLPAATVSNIVGATVINNPHLWNGLADPYLYQTFVEIDQGTDVMDVVAQPLGFRWFSVDPTNGFFLNGRHYDLHGVNMHQDWLNCGWGLTNAQRDTNFLFLKEIGATFVRLSHYEHDDYTYQLADQNGIGLWSEVPIIDYITASAGFSTNTLQQLREMIRQRYNHPSVFCWSVYNEITLEGGPSPTNLISQEAQLVVREDSTRLSTAAANTSDNDPSTFYTQLIAFNKYFGWYSSPLNGIGGWADNIHATYPTRCIGVSEYGAGASIYQHSENPSFPANTASSFHPEEWQNLVIETNWQLMAARPFLWCKLVWNSFDFASDGRNEGDAPGRNDKGMVTYDRQVRKDAFYFFKANWTTNPMVYITGHTFTNRTANAMVAKVYANCGSVQLFLNGVSQGSVVSSNCIFNWPLQLQAGTNFVEAVGMEGGIAVTDSLAWVAPVVPPGAAITNPVAPTVYLGSTNVVLQLAATAMDYQVLSPAPLLTQWRQAGAAGAVVFGDTNALSTTARFGTNGVYTLIFQAAKGALTTNVILTVVVGPVPYGPVEQMRFSFADAGPGTTTPSDVSSGGLNATLTMQNASGAPTDYHGAPASGVAGLTTGSRALNFSGNTVQGGSGPLAATTNAVLALGKVTNFVTSMWFKQSVLLPANIGPRMFVFGNATNTDCGTPNSIGMKFQDASDLWFFVNTNQATAAFGSALPLNTWVFVAMAYDGTNISLYEGSDVTGAVLVSTTPAPGLMVPFGATASLAVGNRLGRDRDFAGWIDDFRFYLGAGDLGFIESLRQAAAGPAALAALPGNNEAALTWNPLWGATSYNIKRSNVSGGPYAVISPAGSVTTTNYLDTAVTNGGTYYYAISASSLLTEAGETANGSAQGMVTLPAIAAAPQVGWNSPVYTGMTLQLTASAGAGASYNWTGPNGFSSTSQNPVLAAATVADSGLYTVVAFGGGVASAPATVNVLVNPPVPFTVHPSPDGLIFNWPYGLLESATNISGPWVNLTGANSPYTNPVTAPQGFFRVQLQ